MNNTPGANDAAQRLSDNHDRLQRYIKFLDIDPDNQKLIIDALALALELGEINIAKNIVDVNESRLQENSEYCACAGYFFLATQDYDKAMQYFVKAVALGNVNPIVIFNMAMCHFYRREFELAFSLLSTNQSVEQYLPKEYLLLSARIKHHLDDFEGAIRDLKVLHKEYEWQPESAALLALIMFEFGSNPSEVLKLANDALTESPLLIEALLARGSLCLESGDHIQALSDAETATQHHIESGRAWSLLGLVHFNNFHFELARDTSKKAVNFMPDHIGTWHTLGWSHIMLGESKEALNAFQQSYNLDRSFGETHGGLAAVYAQTNDRELANKHLEIAQKLNPNSFGVVFAKIILLNDTPQSSEAKQILEKAINKTYTGSSMPLKNLMERRLFEFANVNSDKIH